LTKKLYLVAADFLHPGDYASFRERLLTLGARPVLTEVGAEWASRRTLANPGGTVSRGAAGKVYAGYTRCDHCGIYDDDPAWCDLCGKGKSTTGLGGGTIQVEQVGAQQRPVRAGVPAGKS
jgi:hypothetical protein